MKWIFIILLLFLLSCAPRAEYTCPNCSVILISIDTLRADHLGIYGYDRNTTPNIDAIARQSYVFTNVRSESSWTSPAHAALLFSKYPHELGFYKYIKPGKINDSELSLAEALKQIGYSTQAYTGDAYVAREYAFDQGFDDYVDTFKFGGFENFITNSAEWLARHKGKPHFLFLHGYNTHTPYSPPLKYKKLFYPEYNGKYDPTGICRSPPLLKEELDYAISQYDAEIKYVDDMLGMLFENLSKTGQLDSTIIVITSDHGEEFYEHGQCDHLKTLYDELLRVPLIIKTPEGAHKRISSPVQLSDVYPTIIELIGAPQQQGIRGRSLVPLLAGASWERPQISITQVYGIRKKAITREDWKLIETSPTWKPHNWMLSPLKPYIIDNRTALQFRTAGDKLIINLNELRETEPLEISVTLKAKADRKPAILRAAFNEIQPWPNSTIFKDRWIDYHATIARENFNKTKGNFKETTIQNELNVSADSWKEINLPPYQIQNPNQYQLIIEKTVNETIWLDELSIFESGTNRLLKHFDFDENEKTYELYNLKEDPGEQKNLVSSDNEMLESLKKQLDAAFSNATQQEAEVVLREEVKEQLKALGYVG